MKERDIIARLKKEFPGSGIGDDTAILSPLDGDLLFASDAAVEKVHFERSYSSAGQVIQKLVTANVSDIYAMGGRARAIVLSAALSKHFGEIDLDSVIEGLKVSCDTYGIELVGGDTVSSPGGMFFDVAIMGTVPRGEAKKRSGARVGDVAVIFGEIGLSRAGLSLLGAFLGGPMCSVESLPKPKLRDCSAVGSRLRNILPRLSLATSTSDFRAMAAGLAYLPHAADALRFLKHYIVPRCLPVAESWSKGLSHIDAMIDISDGLAKDIRTLCEESGVGVVIEAERLPIPDSIASLFDFSGDELVNFALSSGEEYVLLASVRPEAAEALPPTASVIGRFVEKDDGMIISSATGSRELPNLGWEHEF